MVIHFECLSFITGGFANQAAWSFQNAIKATKQGPAAGCRLTLRSFCKVGSRQVISRVVTPFRIFIYIYIGVVHGY